MNALLRLFALAAPLALAACATSTAPALAVAPSSAPQAESPHAEEDPHAALRDDEQRAAIPRQALSAEWLYGLLAGELAAQRGAVGQSAATYLELARATRDPRVAQRAAEFALYAGQLDAASEALTLWLELDPDANGAREQLIVTLLRGGKLAQSRPLLETTLRQQPKRAAVVFVQLARLAARQSDKAGAAQLVRELAAQYPALPEARFALIAVASEAGDDATVDAEFTRLRTLAPSWELPLQWQLERLRGQSPAAAIAFLARELEQRPQASAELHTNYARLLAGEKRYAVAEQHLQAQLARHGGDAELRYVYGLLAYQNGNYAVARQQLEIALAAGYRDQNGVRYTLGQLAEEQKQVADARRWYLAVVDGDNLLPARLRAAQLQAVDGQWQAAIDSLAPLVEQGVPLGRVRQAQAALAKGAKQYPLALTLLGQALQEDAGQTDWLYERALLLDSMGRYGEAEQDLRQVLMRKPDDPQTLNALGYILANQGQKLQEARGMIERALKADPDNVMVIDSMGWVLFKQGHYQEALHHLQLSYAKLQDAEVAAHLGEVLWQLGRQDEARQIWEAARKAEPEHPVLQETLKRLLP